MMSLSKLVQLLENDVPQIETVPGRLQVEQAVRAAVDDFSMRAPMRKVTAINVVSGTVSYTMPLDFSKLIKVCPVGGSGNMGLVAVPMGSVTERAFVQGDKLVFYPPPSYAGQREVHYAARYALDEGRNYQDMTEPIAHIVLLKAKAILTNLLATNTGGDGWKYSIGDESVDKSTQGNNLRQNADHFHNVYMEAVNQFIGFVGVRG